MDKAVDKAVGRVMRRIVLLGAVAAVWGAQVAAQALTTDVVFNVKIKVEGNVAAVDTGVAVSCLLTEANAVKFFGEATLLPRGQVFAPQTADGFIEGQVVIPNVPLQSVNGDPKGWDWSCSAVKDAGAPGDRTFTSAKGRALPPVTAGTCDKAFGAFDALGQATREPTQRCALP